MPTILYVVQFLTRLITLQHDLIVTGIASSDPNREQLKTIIARTHRVLASFSGMTPADSTVSQLLAVSKDFCELADKDKSVASTFWAGAKRDVEELHKRFNASRASLAVGTFVPLVAEDVSVEKAIVVKGKKKTTLTNKTLKFGVIEENASNTP